MSEPVALLADSKGDWQLVLEDRSVLFSYHALFDRETQEWDSYCASFAPEDVAAGIRELLTVGEACVDGPHGELTLRYAGDTLEVQLRSDHRQLHVVAFPAAKHDVAQALAQLDASEPV